MAAILVACGKPVEKRRVGELVALDDGSALLTWQDPGRGFGVTRVDADGRILWRTDLEGRPDTVGGDRGVFVADGLVTIRTYHRSERRAMVEGIELESGRASWATRLHPEKARRPSSDPFAGFATNDVIRSFLRSAGPGSELIDLDAKTGREIRRQALPVSVTYGAAPLRLGSDLILHHGFEAVVATREDVTKVQALGFGCVIGNDYWRLVGTAERWELAPLRSRTSAIPVASSGPGAELVGCRDYRGLFVIFMRGAPNLLRVLDTSGTVVRELELEGILRLASEPPASTALPFTRFLPVISRSREDTLVVLDLERGAVAWKAPLPSGADVFRRGSRWYWGWREASEQMIASFDGNTGAVKAIRVRSPSVAPFEPASVAGDSLWLLPGLDYFPDSQPPVGRLDAGTLQVKAATTDFDIVEVPLEVLKQSRNP